MHTLDRALLYVEDVVDGDSIDPGLELAAKVELRQPRDDAHENLLRRILRVPAVPQHAERKAIDVALQRSDEVVEGLPLTIDRSPREILEHDRLRHHGSINDFSVASSDRRRALCASRAPSTCSSATGGACRTKL